MARQTKEDAPAKAARRGTPKVSGSKASAKPATKPASSARRAKAPTKGARASTPTKTRRLSPDARRRQLLDDASRILTEEGLEKLQVSALAERAGVSRPLVYRAFPTRHALFRAILEDFTDAIDRRFHSALLHALPKGGIEAIERHGDLRVVVRKVCLGPKGRAECRPPRIHRIAGTGRCAKRATRGRQTHFSHHKGEANPRRPSRRSQGRPEGRGRPTRRSARSRGSPRGRRVFRRESP
ncbi:MAG: TetR/AcrR family transcriptional regulator [Gemmatimonadetes bacterium]|nr:TetR/AcrR family transcriptional regulator [Gemmatimonadota bacterium]